MSASLRVVKHRRAVLYLRQSVAREESISLELQETAGREHCARMGYEVVAVESDPGISGRTWKRPAVQRVMGMIDAGEVDVIVLWKWSRLSRSRLDWAVAADRVQTAGGLIESATEPLDTSTSTGRLARGMLTEFAAFESERIGDVWRESHARRIRNGLPANGKPRYGYQYSREHGFTPDPLTAPVLVETYRRYLAGESVYSLVAWLNAGPTRPVSGYGVSSDGLWSDRTIRRVLDSGFAAGYIRSRGELIPGAHEALITLEEWQRFEEARGRRRTFRRTERSEYVLSGLIRCACGSTMTAGQFGAGHVAKYRCKAAHDKRTHTGGYVTATFAEEHVLNWLRAEQAGIAERARTKAAGYKPRRGESELEAIDRKLARIEANLETLGRRLVDPGIPHGTYVRIRDDYLAEKAQLEQARRSAAVGEWRSPVILIPALLDGWQQMLVPERREMLRGAIQYLEVTPGRPRASFVIVDREGNRH